MNLFDQLVTVSLNNQPNLSSLRAVVEKELLHHDILRTLRDHNLLNNLTFIGGTCLRCCYGGTRLSEDLDFTGGLDFSKETLSEMGNIIVTTLSRKYGLHVNVSSPVKEDSNVDTWKVKIETRPNSTNLPIQRINIDICAVKSYERRPVMLLNRYGVDMGTSGLIIQAQSREEIYTDKLIAFALRPNRIKYRDIWDILWLHEQGVTPRLSLLSNKLEDRKYDAVEFLSVFNDRVKLLSKSTSLTNEFYKEMQRFLPIAQLAQLLEQPDLWIFLTHLMQDFGINMSKELKV